MKPFILLIGATGRCGNYTLKDFLNKGYNVRLVVRDKN